MSALKSGLDAQSLFRTEDRGAFLAMQELYFEQLEPLTAGDQTTQPAPQSTEKQGLTLELASFRKTPSQVSDGEAVPTESTGSLSTQTESGSPRPSKELITEG
jgi:hypothetical protein